MYTDFYQLQRKPFQITTDPAFLWLGATHREALTTLKYGVLDQKGFLLLTGDVGTGKTTLINALLKSLHENVLAAMISDPSLSRLDFYRLICIAFGVPGEIHNKSDFLKHFSCFLYQAHAEKRTVLLIIDETQRLKHDLLEEIRMLSNIEKADAKLLNIFFVGQGEVNALLLRPENRALRKRITITYHLNPLTRLETCSYIAHRLKTAGAAGNILSSDAMACIYDFSNGFPRQINILCDLALLCGFEASRKTIDKAIVKKCRERISFPLKKQPAAVATQRKPASPRLSVASGASTNRFLPWAVGLATILVVGTAGLLVSVRIGGQQAPDSRAGRIDAPVENALPENQNRTKVTATLMAPSRSDPRPVPSSRLPEPKILPVETKSAGPSGLDRNPEASTSQKALVASPVLPAEPSATIEKPPESIDREPEPPFAPPEIDQPDDPDPLVNRRTPTAVRFPVPETPTEPSSPPEMTAPHEPDPSDVVDWLLHKKQDRTPSASTP
ncbi:ExeA family protein [Desulfosarcina ovata]|uniref:AAA+ ATPase domain-containing protein n=1 Tax=Desulfosarcina ovata subsp. ovata TaxID=2752305 RepID=A0A5K8AD04_9BACT|nr:AAA family ATPase [Desulfosarcina ovata]BBO90505.1 hypothetical protein DSCOOX_36850 [Desulfosarcina ovata subsp. ovata]